jgi:hypothetical protein
MRASIEPSGKALARKAVLALAGAGWTEAWVGCVGAIMLRAFTLSGRAAVLDGASRYLRREMFQIADVKQLKGQLV